MLPRILKVTADSQALRRTFDYHIDWEMAAGGDGRLKPPAGYSSSSERAASTTFSGPMRTAFSMGMA